MSAYPWRRLCKEARRCCGSHRPQGGHYNSRSDMPVSSSMLSAYSLDATRAGLRMRLKSGKLASDEGVCAKRATHLRDPRSSDAACQLQVWLEDVVSGTRLNDRQSSGMRTNGRADADLPHLSDQHDLRYWLLGCTSSVRLLTPQIDINTPISDQHGSSYTSLCGGRLEVVERHSR